jgi:hypothetical protein
MENSNPQIQQQQQQWQQEHVILGDDDDQGREQLPQQEATHQERREIRVVANYTIETYTYYYYYNQGQHHLQQQQQQQLQLKPLHVQMESATTTRGSNLTSEQGSGHDLTGIMIWPATHLLCQYLCFDSATTISASPRTKQRSTSNDNHKTSLLLPSPPPSPLGIGKTVVELGCGCGLLGVTAVKFVLQKEQENQQQQERHDDDDEGLLWVSTDMDERALSLCRRNHALNGINVRDMNNNNATEAATTNYSSSPRCHVQQLRWGDPDAIQATLSILEKEHHHYHHHRRQQQHEEAQKNCIESATTTARLLLRFDAVVGADIVYPSTSLEILQLLFDTVDQLLSPDGSFWLSFATRDGHKTPVKLLQAASQAGFTISCVHLNDPAQQQVFKQLPPLLDSKLLVLQRNARAVELNARLGNEQCTVFPGLQRAVDAALHPQSSSDEEWEPPFFNEEDDEDVQL